MFRSLILYSLMITQLLILKVLNLINDVIKTLEPLKMHILMMICHAFLIVERFLMFKYKFFLTHILKTIRQLSLFSIYLT